ALALGDAILVDFAIDRVAGIGVAVAALGIGFLLDHQLAVVPARLGRCLAGRAAVLHEGDLALALVVEGVGRPDVLLAGRRSKPGARTPVALEETQLLLLLGVGRHDHRLGLVLLLVLVGHRLVRTVGALVIGTLIIRALRVVGTFLGVRLVAVGTFLVRLAGEIDFLAL